MNKAFRIFFISFCFHICGIAIKPPRHMFIYYYYYFLSFILQISRSLQIPPTKLGWIGTIGRWYRPCSGKMRWRLVCGDIAENRLLRHISRKLCWEAVKLFIATDACRPGKQKPPCLYISIYKHIYKDIPIEMLSCVVIQIILLLKSI